MSNDSVKAAMNGAAEVEADPVRKLFRVLETKASELQKQLPPHISADFFIGVCKTAVLAKPDLAFADHRTFFIAALKCAGDGLLPDGREAVFNCYSTKVKNKRTNKDEWIDAVQYLPMAQGLIKLLYESGEVKSVDAAAVYQNDQFDYVRGDMPSLTHRPTPDDDPGKIVAAYMVIHLQSGEIKREVMFRRDIMKVKAVSKATGENSPWAKWEDQMAIKSVIHRAYKQLPHSPRLEKKIRNVLDNDLRETGDASIAAPMAIPADISHGEQFNQFDGNFERTVEGEQVTTGTQEQSPSATTRQAEPQESGKGSEAAADPHQLTQATLIATMRKRTEVETLDIDADLIRNLPADQQDEATQAYHAARALLTGELPKKTTRQNRIGGAE